MKGSDIKKAIGKLEPDNCMEYRLAEKLKGHSHKRFSFKPAAALALSLAIVVCAGLFAADLLGYKIDGNQGNVAQSSGVYIPKVELAESSNAKGKMIGLIVYQGRVYLQSALQLDPETAVSLMGEKIGKTKGNINEWSKQDDYAVELASTVGIQDVYMVKGYDKSFRIMTYEKTDSMAYAQLFECLNGIMVKTGADIFDKFKIEGNIENAKYELFDSWNNGKQEFKPIADLGGLNDFITALNKSIPYKQEGLEGLWEDQSADSQKFVYLTLKDGTEVQLRIFKDGYVHYNFIDIYFKVDESVFSNFWNELK